MDWNGLPPLSALRAFAAFSDTGSVVKAGDALGVSHAAISQHIRKLEAHMNLALVDRASRALELTPDGVQLAEALAEGFGTMDRTIAALTGADAERPVHISTTQLFAMTWLMPRLMDFQEKHPGIDLMVNPSAELTDPGPGGFDLALRFGAGGWPGLTSEMLVPTDIVITAAPSLVKDRIIADPCDLLDLPWLQELGTNDSADWLRKHGVTQTRVKRVIHVPGNLMLDGARAGQGVISTAMSSVEQDVRAGNLQVLFRDKGDTGYHIVTKPGVLRPAAKSFIRWLRRQKSPAAQGTSRHSS
ncbi:MAG: LysR family transcriptional regulator [Pseudomonadota bacterium]